MFVLSVLCVSGHNNLLQSLILNTLDDLLCFKIGYLYCTCIALLKHFLIIDYIFTSSLLGWGNRQPPETWLNWSKYSWVLYICVWTELFICIKFTRYTLWMLYWFEAWLPAKRFGDLLGLVFCHLWTSVSCNIIILFQWGMPTAYSSSIKQLVRYLWSGSALWHSSITLSDWKEWIITLENNFLLDCSMAVCTTLLQWTPGIEQSNRRFECGY